MSFATDVMYEEFANTDSSERLKNQFNKYCDWCWGMVMGIVAGAESNFINCIYHYEHQKSKKN